MRRLPMVMIVGVTVTLGAGVGTARGQSALTNLLSPVSAWSGTGCTVVPWSTGMRVTFPQGNYNVGRSFTSTLDVGAMDYLLIKFQCDVPVTTFTLDLMDSDGTFSSNDTASLSTLDPFQPGQTYTVLWPFRANPGWVRYGNEIMDYTKIAAARLTVSGGYFTGSTLHLTVLEMRFTSVMGIIATPSLRQQFPVESLTVSLDPNLANMTYNYFFNQANAQQTTWTNFIADAAASNWPGKKSMLRAGFYQSINSTSTLPTRLFVSKGTVTLPRATIEKIAFTSLRNIYVAANLYIPRNTTLPAPGILLLPGHGNPLYSLHQDAYTLCAAGYVVLQVESYGCGSTGEVPEVSYNLSEYHGGSPAAALLPIGKTLLTMETLNHLSALNYLRTRSEVIASKIGASGCSGGATHTLWTMIADDNVTAGGPVSAMPVDDPDYFMHHCCHCDLGYDIIPNTYGARFQELLCPPQRVLRCTPGDEMPSPRQDYRDWWTGKISYNTMLSRAISADQLPQWYQEVTSLYSQLDASSYWSVVQVANGHTYTNSRQTILNFFDIHLKGLSTPNPPVTIDPSEFLTGDTAKSQLTVFPNTASLPSDMQVPSKYIHNQASGMIRWSIPSSTAAWQTTAATMRQGLSASLGPFERRWRLHHLTATMLSVVPVPPRRAYRYLLTDDDGIKIPVVIIYSSNGRIGPHATILTHYSGYTSLIGSQTYTDALATGETLVLMDLRGTGQTRPVHEDGGYLNLRDHDLGLAATRLGKSIAGLWVEDYLSVMDFLQKLNAGPLKFKVIGFRETGFAALCTACFDSRIDQLDLRELLASYDCSKGPNGESSYFYGRPYYFNGDNSNLGGYGSVAPFLFGVLRSADIPQILALTAPCATTVRNPVWASGKALLQTELSAAFNWTSQLYALLGQSAKFSAVISN